MYCGRLGATGGGGGEAAAAGGGGGGGGAARAAGCVFCTGAGRGAGAAEAAGFRTALGADLVVCFLVIVSLGFVGQGGKDTIFLAKYLG